MKLLRPLLIGAAAVLVLLVVGVAVVLTPSFQTWQVQRALARQPGLHLTVGHVAVTPGRVLLFDVAYERDGVRVSAPRIEADLPVLPAVVSRRVYITDIQAKGWTIDASALRRSAANARSVAAAGALPAAASGSAIASGPPPAETFSGLLPRLGLPFDLAIDRLNAAGEVRLPAGFGQAQVTIIGGGLAAGHEAKFDVTADAALPGATVKSLQTTGQVIAVMDSPRTFARIGATIAATAAGTPVALRADFAATRSAAGENYSLVIARPDRKLLEVEAQLPQTGRHLAGTWKLDVHDSDVARFALGRPLPTFTGVGEGTVDTDVTFTAVHIVGRIDAAVDRLAALGSKLAGIGAIHLAADLDVWQRGPVLSVSRLTVDVAGPDARAVGAPANAGTHRSVAKVRALQAFDFNPKTGDLHATDPARDLVGIALDGVPLAWARPFLEKLELSGSDIRGELVVTPRAGGLTVHTVSPLSVARLTVGRAGQPWLRDVDVSLNGSGDYTPDGWQAELAGMTAKSGESTVLLLDAKAGQLKGEGRTVKATGLISFDLAALAAQPVMGAAIPLRHGEGTIEFAGSFGPTQQIEAKVTLKHLAADPKVMSDALPDLSATVRADIAEDGHVAVNVPIVLQREGRQSDLSFIGSLGPLHSGRPFEAQVMSTRLVIDDVAPLGAIWRATKPKALPSSDATTPPPWAGWNGTVALQLKRVVYSNSFEMSNVVGTVRITGGVLDFDHVHAGVGEGGDALVNGRVSFNPEQKQFAARADVALLDFNPAPLLRSVNPRQPPPIEGKFGVASHLNARAGRLELLPPAATGTFEMTSKSGTFRALRVDVGNLVENSGKLASWIASAGNAIAGLAGRKEDYDEITSRSQAANELAKALSAIAYDQLNLVVTRDEALNSTVKEFALISPEFRLTGGGLAKHVAGKSIVDDEISLELQLRARGRPAELMKYLGVLEAKPDDLGYSTCTIPIKLTGTLANLDARDFSNRLIALAVEKTGIMERAGAKALDWINRLRGKG